MRHFILLLAIVPILAAVGCANKWSAPQQGYAGGAEMVCPEHGNQCPQGCQHKLHHCGPGGCGHSRGGAGAEAIPGPIGPVTYPYYTTRGPRDFLQRNPTPIGP